MIEVVVGYGEICRNHGIGGPEALDDVLTDYEMMAESYRKMTEKFQTEALPVRMENGIFICPECGHRIKEWYTHCNHCGKKVGWNGLLNPRNRRNSGGKNNGINKGNNQKRKFTRMER